MAPTGASAARGGSDGLRITSPIAKIPEIRQRLRASTEADWVAATGTLGTAYFRAWRMIEGAA
jgi:hypothetical protein